MYVSVNDECAAVIELVVTAILSLMLHLIFLFLTAPRSDG